MDIGEHQASGCKLTTAVDGVWRFTAAAVVSACSGCSRAATLGEVYMHHGGGSIFVPVRVASLICLSMCGANL